MVTHQQDGAPSHRSIHTLAILQTNVSDFIELSKLAATQPDLNPVHCLIWGAPQELINRQKFENIDHLKQDLNSCWVMISQEIITVAVGQWSK